MSSARPKPRRRRVSRCGVARQQNQKKIEKTCRTFLDGPDHFEPKNELPVLPAPLTRKLQSFSPAFESFSNGERSCGWQGVGFPCFATPPSLGAATHLLSFSFWLLPCLLFTSLAWGIGLPGGAADGGGPGGGAAKAPAPAGAGANSEPPVDSPVPHPWVRVKMICVPPMAHGRSAPPPTKGVTYFWTRDPTRTKPWQEGDTYAHSPLAQRVLRWRAPSARSA